MVAHATSSSEHGAASDERASADRTVIVGGGVAAVEALLALRALLGEAANTLLISPRPDFSYRPLAVAEPFGRIAPGPWDLEDLVSSAGGDFVQDAVVSVDGGAKQIATESGAVFGYANLLLALGVKARQVLPGATAYRGAQDNDQVSELLDSLEAGSVESVAFVVPTAVKWPLPLYELALQTAAFAAQIDSPAELTLVTHEARPLSAFGREASASVQDLLDERGISTRLAAAAARVRGGELVLMNGHRIVADRFLTLPAPEADRIAGIPQGPHGLIDTDPFMRVESMTDVYAAGDATWFPIKQGGIASQQADTAARAIASLADPQIDPTPFRPILRGALLTGGAPKYLRGETARPEVSAAGTVPLWSPPSKIAARYLSPFLAQRSEPGAYPPPAFRDLAGASDADPSLSESDHAEVVELALISADADARWGDYRTALRWLAIAEALELTLTPEYARKRAEWEAQDQAPWARMTIGGHSVSLRGHRR